MSTAPVRIGKYRITGVLGYGAMGVVYRGFDPLIERAVAIKTLRPDGATGLADVARAAERFRNEARAVGRIAHPGVVAIHEFGEHDGKPFMAMELVHARNLDQVLSTTPSMPEAEAVAIMGQLLDALDAAHAQGVWHRDLKPANLLITADGRLKLTDFGIARIDGGDSESGVSPSVQGSPGYMAPEQYLDAPADHRVDLFAAGVLFYRLLTGKPPFTGSADDIKEQLFSQVPPLPSAVLDRPRLRRYDAVMTRALARDPAQRFLSAVEFRQALQVAVAQDQGLEDTQISLPVHWFGASQPTPVGGAAAPSAPSAWAESPLAQAWLARLHGALTTQLGAQSEALVMQAAQGASHQGEVLMRLLATSVGIDRVKLARDLDQP
ncbi:MAG: serine/threonine protein kinase [Burkholderiales bacterium PBB6]|nr:MAG: serine/threonine protein kinase [Burkholderiales bacterium PBB6]